MKVFPHIYFLVGVLLLAIAAILEIISSRSYSGILVTCTIVSLGSGAMFVFAFRRYSNAWAKAVCSFGLLFATLTVTESLLRLTLGLRLLDLF